MFTFRSLLGVVRIRLDALSESLLRSDVRSVVFIFDGGRGKGLGLGVFLGFGVELLRCMVGVWGWVLFLLGFVVWLGVFVVGS